MTLSELSRDEKLLIAASLDVDTEENTGDGHNTAWTNTVDLVLSGRKGLLDHSDEELDRYLRAIMMPDLLLKSKDEVLLWARQLSRIDRVDSAAREWRAVDVETQERWNQE